MNNITHKIYTIKELRDWLLHNAQNGLSPYCISRTRAYSLINNPCAEDNDPAIVVAFNEERPIGYSAVFADEYVAGNTIGRFFWGTTEWIEPEYRGKGIAGKMMRTLKESVGIDKYIGLESSTASIMLDKKQGAGIVFYNRIRFKIISNDSLKERILSKCIFKSNNRILGRLEGYDFQNEYVRFIDDFIYDLISTHYGNDVFLRQRVMLNWILQYPFYINIHGDSKAFEDICEFGGSKNEYCMDAVKVLVGDRLVGFYMVSQSDNCRTLRYLYYDDGYKDNVFASATLNLLKPGVEIIRFMSDDLLAFMQQHGIKHLNRKSYYDEVALTLPPEMTVNPNLHIQGGDGDMFC